MTEYDKLTPPTEGEKARIENGKLIIDHMGGAAWRWSRETSFSFTPLDSTIRLKTDQGVNYHPVDLGKDSSFNLINDENKDILFEKFDVKNN